MWRAGRVAVLFAGGLVLATACAEVPAGPDADAGGVDEHEADGGPGDTDAGIQPDGGTGIDPDAGTAAPQTLLSGLDNPQAALALAPGMVFVGGLGGVVGVNKDGTGRVDITAGGGTQKGLASDGAHVFWANDLGIHSATIAGQDHRVLASTGQAAAFLTVDAVAVYWTEFAFGVTDPQRLGKVGTDGSDPITLVDASATGAIPWTIAVDGSHVYWLARGSRSILRAAKDGTNVTPLFTEASPIGSMAMNAEVIVYASSGLFRRAKDGTGRQLLAAASPETLALAVDDTSAYWPSDGTLFAVDLDGGGLRIIAENLPALGAVAVDETFLYAVVDGPSSSLLKLPK